MSILRRLIFLFKPYRLWIMGGVIVSLISSLAAIILMGASGWFISAMGLAGLAGMTINYFTPAAIIRACAITRTGGRYAERLVTHEATFRLIARLRCWFYNHLLKIHPSVFGQMQSGDLLGRLRGDIDVLERFYLGFIVPFAVAIIGAILITLLFGLYDLRLGLVIGAMFFVGCLILPLLSFKLTRKSEEAIVNNDATLKTTLAENLQGMDELLIYDTEGQHTDNFNQLCQDKADSQNSLNKTASLFQNSVIILVGLTLTAMLILTIPAIVREDMHPAYLAMFTLLAIACFDIVSPLPQAFQGLGAVIRAANRIFAITDQAQDESERTKDFPYTPSLTIDFNSVEFAYDDETKILQDLSFTLKQGEKIAITGATGSGKSSIVNLLLRLYEPQAGRITFNGHNIKDYNAESIRSHFAVLPQHPYIFAKTIRDNIALGKPDAKPEDIEEAARKAGLHDFIITLPNGYDSHIGEHGHTLSGGQKKRLGLARALLVKAPSLILDEPGEGLDYAMEEEILNRVIDALNGASLILISHRTVGLDKMDKHLNLN